jgi:CDP-diacylglycerol--serine O-phosphatidyltransferase
MSEPRSSDDPPEQRHRRREHRRRRFRRRSRRAYIRSVYFLPSMATLGNAICGFAACYVATLDSANVGVDPIPNWLLHYKFLAAAYLLLLAMVFDALDGRLARFARHTTDFGGQLDSLADVVSFGVAPAFVALQVFKSGMEMQMPFLLTRLIWAIGALYFSCAAIRLARFNVSNEHGEQHHFSFLGLPSPGAAGAVIGLILMQQDLMQSDLPRLSFLCVLLMPLLVLVSGLLMVSNIRYPHLVNRYLRGRRSIGRLLTVVVLALLLVVAHRYVIAVGTLMYALSGPFSYAWARWRPRPQTPPPAAPLPQPPTGG